MNTDNLDLPYIMPSQAQKHVTHNEALRMLDAAVQLAVLDRDLATPPALPSPGDRYIVGPGATGDWVGRTGQIACWQDGEWRFLQPKLGWLAWIADESMLAIRAASAWAGVAETLAAMQNLALLGIGTAADSANPFAAKLNKALWTARPVAEGGDGDLRYTMNKETASDVLSLLMQRGYSGRAEIGLIGDDDFTLKTSGDGASWATSLVADATTGGLRFRANEVQLASAATTDIGAAPGLKVELTGSATVTSLGTAPHALRLLRFAANIRLVHNATSLVLPGRVNIFTTLGDTAIAASDAAGNWRIWTYQRADGGPLVPPLAGRRNAFLNPFFDVSQGYSGPVAITTSQPLPVDMVRFAVAGGGSWQAELADFAVGQTAVPGNPEHFLRVTQPVDATTGSPGLVLALGDVRTFAGEEVTASFWGRVPSGTCSFIFQFSQSFGTGGSAQLFDVPSSSAMTLTTSWQRFSFTGTIAGISGKTVGPGNVLQLRLVGNNTGKFRGEFCGVQVEPGRVLTMPNPIAKAEAETLCRAYYEVVSVRASNGTNWVPCAPKRAVPTVSQSGATAVANATANGCQLVHGADAAAVVTFDARL